GGNDPMNGIFNLEYFQISIARLRAEFALRKICICISKFRGRNFTLTISPSGHGLSTREIEVFLSEFKVGFFQIGCNPRAACELSGWFILESYCTIRKRVP